jgi:hypothetical protein
MEIRRHAPVMTLAVTMLVASFARMAAAGATTYTVGAPDGLWDMHTDYAEWVAARKFHPGDNISKLS